jgi:6,7-dimethyl-8-ribityllumazine synthase
VTLHEFKPDHRGAGLRIGIVVGRFNPEIGEGLLAACLKTLYSHGVAEADLSLVRVPGALEIPLALQKLANSGRFHALIALGAVIRGDTYHFEIVANQSAAGIAQVQMDYGLPVANGVLTTDDEAQAQARVQQKGSDCALVAIEMAHFGDAVKSTWP